VVNNNPAHFANIYRDPEYAMITKQTGFFKTMTNIGDVIRQIEKITCDRQYPPTPEQQETIYRILNNVYSGTMEFKGSR
jgi:hypothetical protein